MWCTRSTQPHVVHCDLLAQFPRSAWEREVSRLPERWVFDRR